MFHQKIIEGHGWDIYGRDCRVNWHHTIFMYAGLRACFMIGADCLCCLWQKHQLLFVIIYMLKEAPKKYTALTADGLPQVFGLLLEE